jgi:hypothetical protein
MARSGDEHLATLQAHGLTLALLERFASFVGQGKIGSFVFHTGPGGRILAYEEHHKGRVDRLDLLQTLEDARNGPHTASD